jgi:hypothetical protein
MRRCQEDERRRGEGREGVSFLVRAGGAFFSSLFL